MARSLRILFVAAMLTAPAGLAARTRVDPVGLAQAALACRGIPDEVGAAERRIVELGWPRMRQREGGSVLGFERGGIMLVLAPPDGQGHTLSCGLFATVRRSVSGADMIAAASAAFGRQPGPGNAGGFPVWELDGGQVVAISFDGEGSFVFNFWYPRNTAR